MPGVYYINARSVLNKLDELKHSYKDFDVIIITETWLNDSTCSSLLSWEGFQLIRQDRDTIRNKKGGGVCIYIRSSIKFEIVNELQKSLDNNIEYVYIKLKPHMQKSIYLMGIYRPPDGKYRDFIQYITQRLNQIDRSRSDTLLIGDFNIDFNDKKLMANSTLDILENKYGLKQMVKTDTRITDSSSTCIDLIFTDISNIMDSGVINYNISDHLPIYLIKKKIRNKIVKKNVAGRSYLRYDREVFKRLLHLQDWSEFDIAMDPTTLWDCFYDNVVKTLDEICPIKDLKVVDNKPEWLTNDILTKMRQRDKAYKKARRTKRQADWDIAKNLRNRLAMDIQTSKANVIKGKLERHGNNPKKFWEEINKLLPQSNNSTITDICDDVTGELMEGMNLNKHINEYFSTIGSRLANECTPGMVYDQRMERLDNYVEFNRVPFTEQEVQKVCNNINICKSSSLENVKTMVLKHAFLDNITKLTKLFNSSISSSVFPCKWKLSTIVPLPKVPHPNTATDLRPVALTPLPGKLLEKLICDRLQNWLTSNDILTKNQHGFRKKRSTISAIATLLDEIYKNINNNRNSYIIFLDLKKAFDTISHVKMIYKLQAMGLDIRTLSWFESYLTGRRQCVKLNSMTSDTLPITYGVPQGSILGPTLFSIYINEIANIVNCGIVLYADDTVIYHYDRTILQNNLKTISDWCNDNLLTINVKKSHWMRTRVCGRGVDDRDQEIGNCKFTIKNLELKEVDLYKYLGVHIDVNLNFQPHHKKMISHAQLKLSHFRKIRRFIDRKAAILIYKCTVLPILEYADFIQDQGINYINKAIQKLQNFGLLIAHNQHILPYDQRDSSEALHRNSKVFRLVHRRRLHLLQFAFRLKDNITLLDDRDIPTRRRVGILFSLVKSNHYKFPRNPYYRCMLEWNNLPVDVSLSLDIKMFTQAIKMSIANPYMKIL